jgi:GNAT superfamily N-acetyltransferase
VETGWPVRLARDEDIAALAKLIPLSVRELSTAKYSMEQIEAAIDSVVGVDQQLIRDRTYYVVENDGALIGCGGWSKRQTLFGSDHHTGRNDTELDPASQPARIRAFFVHPRFVRRGVGRALLLQCEQAVRAAGFSQVELRATLPGVPFYEACGYTAREPFQAKTSAGLSLEVVRMTKNLEQPNSGTR